MKKLVNGIACGLLSLGGLASSGCVHHDKDVYSKVADPCWPDRYAAESRQRVISQFEPQVANGHVLDQTIWNIHFEQGSEKLNSAGMDKLDQLARRRPSPDPIIYMQTSRDIAYDSDKPANYVTKRTDLDTKRVQAIQKYLEASLTGRAATFNVQVHDPAYPGIEGAAPRLINPAPLMRPGVVQGSGGAGGAGGQQGAGGMPVGGQQPNMGGQPNSGGQPPANNGGGSSPQPGQ